MRHIKYFMLAIMGLVMAAQEAQALQVISPVEGESVFVNISKTELNLIQFPFSGIRAYTSSQKLEIKVQNRQVLVSVTDQAEGKPQEVFFSTPYGTYLLMLVPKAVPAETVMMRIDKGTKDEADDWERDNDYIKRVKELVKALYLGNPPSGYAINTAKSDAGLWEGLEQTVILTMTGAGLIGEVQNIVNHGEKPVRITESEFYTEGVLAVSLTSHDLKTGQKEQVFIVRRNNASAKNSGQIENTSDTADTSDGDTVVKHDVHELETTIIDPHKSTMGIN
jgi:hypothetical protein